MLSSALPLLVPFAVGLSLVCWSFSYDNLSWKGLKRAAWSSFAFALVGLAGLLITKALVFDPVDTIQDRLTLWLLTSTEAMAAVFLTTYGLRVFWARVQLLSAIGYLGVACMASAIVGLVLIGRLASAH